MLNVRDLSSCPNLLLAPFLQIYWLIPPLPSPRWETASPRPIVSPRQSRGHLQGLYLPIYSVSSADNFGPALICFYQISIFFAKITPESCSEVSIGEVSAAAAVTGCGIADVVITVKVVAEKVSFCGGTALMQGVFLPPLGAVPNSLENQFSEIHHCEKGKLSLLYLVGLLPQKSSFRALFLQCSFSRLWASVCLTFYHLRSFVAEASFSDSVT